MMRDPEYDRFGPWILEISDLDPVPPLFEPHMPDAEGIFYSFKIPRHEERRNLRPGMNMYDYVVALGEERIWILERRDTDVQTQSVAYGELAALRHREDLLDGHLYLHTPGRVYDIPYSTVSADIIEKTVDMIRPRYSKAAPDSRFGSSIRVPPADEDEMGFYFSILTQQLDEKYPGFRMLARQGERRVSGPDIGWARRLLYGVIDKRLLPTIHASDGRELLVIGRDRRWGYRWQAIYGTETLYLPLEKIRGVEAGTEESAPGVLWIVILADDSEFRFGFMPDNPFFEEYRKLLEKLGSPGPA